jgi:hypothetical protein
VAENGLKILPELLSEPKVLNTSLASRCAGVAARYPWHGFRDQKIENRSRRLIEVRKRGGTARDL